MYTNSLTISQALGVVLELAEQNAIEDSEGDYNLEVQRAKQEAALEMIEDLRLTLSTKAILEDNPDRLCEVTVTMQRERE